MSASHQFNATCVLCNVFRPRCAVIELRGNGKRLIVCDQCRVRPDLKGKFRIGRLAGVRFWKRRKERRQSHA